MASLVYGYSNGAIALLIVANFLMLTAFAFVVARLFSRYFIIRSLALDDLFASLALITSTATIIQLATQILYTTTSGLIKLTILLLYLRLFPGLHVWILSTIGFIAVMCIAFIFAAIFQCNKVGSFWVTGNEAESNCVNTLILWCDLAVAYLVTNIWIFALPLPTLAGLHLSRGKKLMAIALLCSAGFVTVVAAVVRLYYVIVLHKGDDPSRDSVPIHMCSAVEINVALIACSIPPLRSAYPLVIDRRRLWRTRFYPFG
ncbi:hypothetical protein BDV59DRAFT_208629 [Aspergillus ambiguus]|uniref:uncharacterized protein n=1 Tax=Aspergillus ambiguus TaxID=176160 RepID=UPI003CCDF037